MRKIKLTVAYDGTDFCGWQSQPGQRTVQGTLEVAAERVVGAAVEIIGSSRTDSGVHALGQVAHFETASALDAATLARAINAYLPEDVQVLAGEEAAADFHAIGSTIRKRYRYVLHDGALAPLFRRRYVWHVRRRLDEAAMHRAGQALRGTHDFASFENQGTPRTTSVRTILDIEVRRQAPPDDQFVHVEVEADGFLYNMVRNITGTLVEVGRGRRPESAMAETLAAKDRAAAGMTAPPQGLFLLWVDCGDKCRLSA